VTDTLKGADYVALRRLSDADDHTLADVGETCERVPAPKDGRTVSDALRLLLASGKIARREPPRKGR
jgi:hypothetical protein